ncbi:MAG: Neutral/alkaline non-lysosomal ceramidase, N-terminal [Pseudomonadota bacterium]
MFRLRQQSIIAISLLACACRISERKDELFSDTDAALTDLNSGQPVSGILLSVGAASAPFIPDKPIALSGYGGIGRRHLPMLFFPGGETAFCRTHEKIDNPPRIKSAVFDVQESGGGRKKLALISLDLVAVTADITQKTHEALASVIAGFTPSLANTLVLASHTHSGVAGLTRHPLWSSFACDTFNKDLSEQYFSLLRRVTADAIGKARPLKSIGQIESNLPALLKSRFAGMPAADAVSLTAFEDAEGKIPFAVAQMAVHPTFYGPRDLVLSADLVAPLEASIRTKSGAEEVFLLQTAIGNMDANLAGATPEAWAGQIAEGLSAGARTQTDQLSISTSAGFVGLPAPEVNWQACGASFAQPFVSLPILKDLPARLPYTRWNLNNTSNIFLAGEWTRNAAEEIRTSISAAQTTPGAVKIFSLANDYTTYHLSSADYQKKSLESCQSIYGKNAVEKISAALRENLQN